MRGGGVSWMDGEGTRKGEAWAESHKLKLSYYSKYESILSK